MRGLSSFCTLLALTAAFTFGCASDTRPNGGDSQEAFFDLSGFMQKEITRLSKEQPRVLKRIAVNGKQEEHKFDSLNYSEELKIFVDSDINRQAWVDKYQVDSSFQQGELQKLTYTATGKDMKIQLLEITFQEGAVASVLVRRNSDSIMADIRQDMQYLPGKGYSLVSAQSTTLSKEKEIELEVSFLP